MKQLWKSPFFQMHLVIFFWGFTGVLGKAISLDAGPLVSYRLIIAAVCLFAYLLVQNKLINFSFNAILRACGIGTLIAIHWLCFFEAIKQANVSLVLGVMSFGAFFASIVEPLIFGRKVRLYEVLIGFVVVIGLLIIIGFEGARFENGIYLAIGSVFAGVMFTVLNGKMVQKHDANNLSLYELVIAFIVCSTYSVLQADNLVESFAIGWYDFILLSILGVFCTAYAFVQSNTVMKYIPPYTLILSINLEKIYGILLAVLLFGATEKMSWQFYLGTTIILACIVSNGMVKNYLEKKAKKAS